MRLRTFVISSAAISILVLQLSAQSVVDYINDIRRMEGVPQLTELQLLNDYCAVYASLMAKKGTASHTLLTAQEKVTIMRAAAEIHGEKMPGLCLENIYSGPSLVLNRDMAWIWKHSAMHWASIIDPVVHYIGVGYWHTGRKTYLCVVVADES